LPTPVRSALRHAYDLLADILDTLRGRDDLTPPRSTRLVGRGDFKEVGEVFTRYFVELGGLRPDDKVLDVGCGVGRMAIPLTKLLSPQGGYWGFDIVKQGIDWCQQHVAARHPGFHFIWSDVYNKTYNPAGRFRASDYVFPFDSGSFDFVCAVSLFTHLLAEDFEHYLSEISRVTKPGGRLFATFFLLNDESSRLSRDGRAEPRFEHRLQGTWVADPSAPENATAYEEGAVRRLFEEHGFRLAEPICYGSWCGRSVFVSYQDMVVAVRG
jgi:ubiquinone/menaquinone biosynthesis C-methylase UbiE